MHVIQNIGSKMFFRANLCSDLAWLKSTDQSSVCFIRVFQFSIERQWLF